MDREWIASSQGDRSAGLGDGRARLPAMITEDATNLGRHRPIIGLGTAARSVAVADEAQAQARRSAVLDTGFDALYKLYRPRVYSWCLRIARNVEDAEDLAQDAFLVLYRKIDTYRGESAFSSWLYRLATNLALMRLRRKTPPQTSLDELLETHEGAINPRQELKTSDRALAASVARVDIDRIFPQLPGGFRKVLFLHDRENYTHLEIAALTGWSVGTSKSQLHRARRRVRNLLECGSAKACHTPSVAAGHSGRNENRTRPPDDGPARGSAKPHERKF